MKQREKVWAVVPAAGRGVRMRGHGGCPKQYLPLGEKRVLDYALAAVCGSDLVDGVVVGVRADDGWWRGQPFAHAKLLGVSGGGETRAETVVNGLRWLLREGGAAGDDWALVHDAARPCLRGEDIARVVGAARAHGAGAILAWRVVDALKEVREGEVVGRVGSVAGEGGEGGEGVSRWRAATPQVFRCQALCEAFEEGLAGGATAATAGLLADESAAMEARGVRARVVEGLPGNLKVTLPADLALAEAILRARGGC